MRSSMRSSRGSVGMVRREGRKGCEYVQKYPVEARTANRINRSESDHLSDGDPVLVEHRVIHDLPTVRREDDMDRAVASLEGDRVSKVALAFREVSADVDRLLSPSSERATVKGVRPFWQSL